MGDYKQFFAICKAHGFDYKDKVSEFTNGRTDSLKSLTDGEFRELMLRLKGLNAYQRKTFTPRPGDLQRKKIIGIARDMHWDKEGKDKLMLRIDEFMINRTRYKRRLNELTLDELNKVLYIFEQEVKRSFLTGFNR